MIVKLYEAKWKHTIDGKLASDFHRSIEEGNVEEVKANSIAILEKCKSFFDPEDQDYVIYEIDDLIESFTDVMDDADEVDFLLDELYDFCDGYNIFISVVDEPAPAEEEPKEVSSEETVELEPKPEEEK